MNKDAEIFKGFAFNTNEEKNIVNLKLAPYLSALFSVTNFLMLSADSRQSSRNGFSRLLA